MPKSKLPPLNTILELYQTKSINQIAELCGVSRQAVWQQLAPLNLPSKKRDPNKQAKIKLIKQLRAEGLSFDEIGKSLGLSGGFCRQIALDAGLDTTRRLKPIGCPACSTRPYAKGLCRNCYHRDRRRRNKGR